MIRRLWSKERGAPALIAAFLASMVVAAPILNAKNAPPATVFLVLPETLPQPQVDLHVEMLGGRRFRLYIETAAFQFTDICVADADAVPVGHAHVHVNGEKVASAYMPIVDVGPLPPGEHMISVVLRGQDHRPIIGKEGLAQGLIAIEVPSGPF